MVATAGGIYGFELWIYRVLREKLDRNQEKMNARKRGKYKQKYIANVKLKSFSRRTHFEYSNEK